jgi:hypothetical protein
MTTTLAQYLEEVIPIPDLVEIITDFTSWECSWDNTHTEPEDGYVTYINKYGDKYDFCDGIEMICWLDKEDEDSDDYINTSKCDCKTILICPKCKPPKIECAGCREEMDEPLCESCHEESRDSAVECPQCNNELVCTECDDIRLVPQKKRSRYS